MGLVLMSKSKRKRVRKNPYMRLSEYSCFSFHYANCSRPKAYYFAIKEMLTIILLSFSTNNIAVFNLCKQEGIKREHYLLVSIYWV